MKSVAVLLGAAVAIATAPPSAAAQYTTNPQTRSAQTSATLSAKLLDEQKKAMQRAATVEVLVAGLTLVDPAATGEVPAAGQGHLHYQVDSGPIIATTAKKLSFHGLTPGSHTIKVMLADNAHNPLGPQQTLNVTVGTQTTSTSGQPSYPTQTHPAPQTQTTSQAPATQSQTQSTAQAQPPVTRTPSVPGKSAQATNSTIVGCVYRERDVPGRTPNVAEQAGILEDYILADVKTTGQTTTPAGGTAGATGTAGSVAAAMYKLEQVADERLRTLVGKRVEVTGRIDADAGEAAGTTGTRARQPDQNVLSPDRIELPELEVTSIREVAGTCPASPAMPRK